MKPLALLCLPLLLSACEITRYPTRAEMFEGNAILSLSGNSPETLDYHLQILNTPVNIGGTVCQGPTTDAVVEAVNALVRQGFPAKRRDLYQRKDRVPLDFPVPADTFLPDFVETLLIDTRGRTVAVGSVFSQDIDGNYFRSSRDLFRQVDRSIDADADNAEQLCLELILFRDELMMDQAGATASPAVPPSG